MSTAPAQRHLSLNVPWGQINLDLGANHLKLSQQWCYRWDVLKGADPCTPAEVAVYHAKVERAIMDAFYGVRIQMTRKQGRTKVTTTVGVSMEVHNAPESRQWTVSVRRVPKDCTVPVSANVNTALRVISATESDLSIRELSRVLHRQCLPMLVAELNEQLQGMQFAL